MVMKLRKRVVLLAACAVLATSTYAVAEGNSSGGGQDPPVAPAGTVPVISADSSVVDTLTALLPLLVQIF